MKAMPRRLTAMGEIEVRLIDPYWRRILNLLNEELDVWDKESIDYSQVYDIIVRIEMQTGIRKKPRPEVEKR